MYTLRKKQTGLAAFNPVLAKRLQENQRKGQLKKLAALNAEKNRQQNAQYLTRRGYELAEDEPAQGLQAAAAYEIREEVNAQAAQAQAENPEIYENQTTEEAQAEAWQALKDLDETENFSGGEFDFYDMPTDTLADNIAYYDNFLPIVAAGVAYAQTDEGKKQFKEAGRVIGNVFRKKKNKKKKDTSAPASTSTDTGEKPEIGAITWGKNGISWGATNNKAMLIYVGAAAVVLIAAFYFFRKK